MRRFSLVAAAAISLAACSSDSTMPLPVDVALNDAGAFGTALTTVGGYDADTYQDRLINALPDEIKLTADQQARIRELIEAFRESTRADREALTAILKEARAAAEAQKTRAEVESILRKGADIRQRLAAAEAKLKADIDGVLTAQQKAWIAGHMPRACHPDYFAPLTDAQKAQIHALEVAFRDNNRADLDLVKSTFEEAQAAFKAGKTQDEIASILAKAAPAILRLESARRTLREQILAVLTPEQKASGCLPLG
ncbi:MAG TPA: Spy/CpxP family protein refolding chaperone [Gemmatimonadaceae bacterium]